MSKLRIFWVWAASNPWDGSTASALTQLGGRKQSTNIQEERQGDGSAKELFARREDRFRDRRRRRNRQRDHRAALRSGRPSHPGGHGRSRGERREGMGGQGLQDVRR